MALGPQRVAPELLATVTKALGITALDQWYYVSHYAITQAIGVRALNDFGGSVANFLKAAYPQHNFDEEKLTPRRNQEKQQKFIEVVIRKLFPNTEIHTKARKTVGIVNPETNAYLEIDFWMPSLKLGIEYQDKHHYGYQWYANGALEEYQKRDDIKRDAMSKLGYTLITIGHWWDKSLESVAATIRKVRPDLLKEYKGTSAEPIPPDPPPDYVAESSVIPGVAGIMSPFIPRGDFNPTNWFAGEKHDGIRGVYNPDLNKMFSRSGNELSVLGSLRNDIPNALVEGEITAGHGNYSRTAALSTHTHHDKVNWSMFRYVIFDIPDAELGNYTQRYSAIINSLMAREFIFAQPAFRVLIANKAHLKLLVDAILSDSGEGVIVQKDARYEYGRAKSLAKIKVRRDADAQILCVNEHSCTCKLVSGATAELICSDGFNPSTLKIGDIVSYYHHGHSQSGKPKQGEIYKVRYDLTWDQIVCDKEYNFVNRKSVKEAIGGSSLTRNTERNRMGYWNNAANVRAFFDQFAETEGFDPLVPDNWYPARTVALRKAGGAGLLNAYNYSLAKALACGYPELKFEARNFRLRNTKTRARTHWKKIANVRAFFDEFAGTENFDPQQPENWYSVGTTALRRAGGSGLLDAYGYDSKKALRSAYPELKFDSQRFRSYDKTKARNKGYWNKPLNVRSFFDDFATTAGFDPLVLENWYTIKSRSLKSAGGSGLLNTFSLLKALIRAYPELEFNAKNFRTKDKAG